MPKIDHIPDAYEEGFAFLASLSANEFELLTSNLLSASLTATFSDLSKQIVAKENTLDIESLKEIFLSVGSLITIAEREDHIDEIIVDVVEICKNQDIVDLEDIDKFQKRLSTLLRTKLIYYIAKAKELSSETGNLFINSRIVSDIRMVFEYDLDTKPSVGIIIHNLHIHYQSDIAAPHEDIFLSMDSNDIENLKEVLVRAQKKEESLTRILQDTGIKKIK